MEMRFPIILLLFIVFSTSLGLSWGSWAHRKINGKAVDNLPNAMKVFYEINREWISEHSSDADEVRGSNSEEEPHHYINIDYYGVYPFEDLPHNYNDAVNKYSSDTLLKMGTIVWHIPVVLESLTVSMREKNKEQILKWSAWLGHYVGDAHQPLHVVLNYNGQLTNQKGIHSRFESIMVERFGSGYLFPTGEAEYVQNPQEESFRIVLESYNLVDSILHSEKIVQQQTVEKEMKPITLFNDAYYSQLNKLIGSVAQSRISQSIQRLSNFWYTAWINAGKPEFPF